MPVKRGAQSSKSEIMVSVRIRPGPSPVVGIENGKVAVRARNGDDLGSMSIDEFSGLLTESTEKKGRTV